jgi:hypothetical protein
MLCAPLSALRPVAVKWVEPGCARVLLSDRLVEARPVRSKSKKQNNDIVSFVEKNIIDNHGAESLFRSQTT